MPALFFTGVVCREACTEALKPQDMLKARLQTPVPTNRACPVQTGNWILRPDRLDERTERKENIQGIFLVKGQYELAKY